MLFSVSLMARVVRSANSYECSERIGIVLD